MTTQVKQVDNQIRSSSFEQLNWKQRWCIQLLLFGFGRWIQIEYAENLTQAPEPSIYAFNHNTTFETLLVPAYLFNLCGKKCTFVVDWMFGHLPIANWFLKQVDPIYAYSKPSTLTWLNAHRNREPKFSVLEQCLSRLNQGQSIGIFPEGTRNRNPFTLLKAKKGLSRLVLASQKPVIPTKDYYKGGSMMNFSEVKTVQEIIRISGKRYPYPAIPPDHKPHFKAQPLSNSKVLS